MRMATEKRCTDCGDTFYVLGPGLIMDRCKDCAGSGDGG